MSESLAPATRARSLSGTERFLRRRKFLIHKKLQSQLLTKSLLHTAVIAVVMGVALFGPLFLTLLQEESPTDSALHAAELVLFLHGRFWPALALAFLLVTLDSIRTSHRIAGPLFRFERTLDQVRDGKVPGPITLRKGDLLETEAELINEALEEARLRNRRIRECERDLLDTTDRLEDIDLTDIAAHEAARTAVVERARALARAAARDD